MTAFLKIDQCGRCRRSLPWEFIPAVLLNGRTMAGTGVWRSQLVDTMCPTCRHTREAEHQERLRAMVTRSDLIRLLGGEKPYRDFTFDRFEITPENRTAFERSRGFNPTCENLYLWGACGVGKTHLAYAIARRGFEETLSVVILSASQLSRKVRMKEPREEEAAIDNLARAEMLILDDLGAGADTAFGRQILQEILDGRDFASRAGLVVTSKYSLDALAAKLADDSIPSRLAGLCRTIEVNGPDRRLAVGAPV